jgi:hypothetical protein
MESKVVCCSYSWQLAKGRGQDFGFQVTKESTSLKPSSVISIQLLTTTRVRDSTSVLPLLESTKNNVQTTNRRKTNPKTPRACCFVVVEAERAFTSTPTHRKGARWPAVICCCRGRACVHIHTHPPKGSTLACCLLVPRSETNQ